MKNGIVVVGSVFVDVKGYPITQYIPAGRNAGRVIQVHGGVSRNVAEDIANIELRPTFVSLVDDTGAGADVVRKLKNHKVNTEYIVTQPDGMGIWLAIFDNTGDVVASISKRPDMRPLCAVLDEKGDEIFAEADSISMEIDLEKEIVKRVFDLAEKHGKKVYALVSNMSVAVERRDFIKRADCMVCNLQEAGIYFSDNFDDRTPEEMAEILSKKVAASGQKSMIVTMGGQGAAWADCEGNHGVTPAKKVDVIDTTGCGDAFYAGVITGLTYGKTLPEAAEIGTRLAASVIATVDSVCPRFLPEEFDL